MSTWSPRCPSAISSVPFSLPRSQRSKLLAKWILLILMMTLSFLALACLVFSSNLPLLDPDKNDYSPVRGGAHGDGWKLDDSQHPDNKNRAPAAVWGQNGEQHSGATQERFQFPDGPFEEVPPDLDGTKKNENPVVPRLAMVVCGERMQEAITSVKSVLMFTSRPFSLHLFVDPPLIEKVRQALTGMSDLNGASLNFELLPIRFPADSEKIWRNLFKLCACQRLFIPEILSSVDSVIYVDTDTVFLRPLDQLWSHFGHFNSSQIAGLVPETEDDSTNWYVRFARHPFFPPRGVNSGVMLMNLTRMRSFGWVDRLLPIYNQYSNALTWGDQDVINIIFHEHSDKLYTFGCEWNFRPDHCMYMSVCRDAEREGAGVIHGSRGFFYNQKQPAFAVLHSAIRRFEMKRSGLSPLLLNLEEKMRGIQATNCGKVWPIFTKGLSRLARDSPA